MSIVEPHLIERINELARLARQRALTEQELEERTRLRREYLHAFRQQTREMLENVRVQYPDGSTRTLKEHNEGD